MKVMNSLHLLILLHWLLFLFFSLSAVRLNDEIQCAAGRIVHAIRSFAQNRNVSATKGNSSNSSNNSSSIDDNEFYSLHVRRGDFATFASATNIEATEIYQNIRDEIPDGSVIYISTDEKNKNYFHSLKEHYDIKFMDDFMKELRVSPVNTNYYGMIDQLVVSSVF
jgi:hypothetical protein